MSEEIQSCDWCSQCCKNTVIPFTWREVHHVLTAWNPSLKYVFEYRPQKKAILEASDVSIPSDSDDLGLFAFPIQCVQLWKDWKCKIYNSRPQACIDYERGSPACIETRKRKPKV